MINSKHILVAPMDWGIGHATRCIPIIQQLLGGGHQVTIASAGPALVLLKARFPGVGTHEMPSYNVRYKTANAALDIALQTPSILSTIKAENKWLKESGLLDSLHGIISDNRYGLYTEDVQAVLITHQLNPKFPTLFQGLAMETLKNQLSRFERVWVPDYPEDIALSGDLSRPFELESEIEFTGPLSRFNAPTRESEPEYTWLGIVSGPENQRTKFERKLLGQFQQQNGKCLIIAGQPQEKRDEVVGNTRIVAHLRDEAFSKAVSHSKNMVARSGYSTIMDLCAMRRTALLVPTPKQSEQEYLAARCQENSWFASQSQKNLNLQDVDLTGYAPPVWSENRLGPILNRWIDML